MGKLIYSLSVSLDGFVETPDHGLYWPVIDDELHNWFNDQARALDASLYTGPVLEELRRDSAGDIDVGPNLAAQFVRRGLVHEYRLVVHPVVLGAGTPFWPDLDAPLPLRSSKPAPSPPTDNALHRTFPSFTQAAEAS